MKYKLKELSGKRVMITGGLGMIGSNIANKLVNYNAKVTIVDACISPFGYNIFNLEGIEVELVSADIRDKNAMKRLVVDKDIIFNLAGQVSHNSSINNPFLDADINYIGHLNVVENVKRYNPKARILFSGSRLQFGPIQSNPVNENHPLHPETPYAFNKTVAEKMYRFYHDNYGISSVVFRIANPYGIRSQMKHSQYSLVNFFIRQAMENNTLTIFGDGEQLRDYIYVEDLADAFLLASVSRKVSGEVFNIGSGVGTKFKDMVNTIVDVVGGGEAVHTPWPDNFLNVETGDYVTDITKISKMLNWKPSINFRDGIKKTYEFYKKHYKHYF